MGTPYFREAIGWRYKRKGKGEIKGEVRKCKSSQMSLTCFHSCAMVVQKGSQRLAGGGAKLEWLNLRCPAPTLVGERRWRSSNETHGEMKNLRF